MALWLAAWSCSSVKIIQCGCIRMILIFDLRKDTNGRLKRSAIKASHLLIGQGLSIGQCSNHRQVRNMADRLEAQVRGLCLHVATRVVWWLEPLSSRLRLCTTPPQLARRTVLRIFHRRIRGQNQGSWKALSKLQGTPDERPSEHVQ